MILTRIKQSLLVLTLFLLSACQSSSLPTLHLFIWSNYIRPDLIARFEEKYHCKVVIDTFDSNESMYAKLKLGSLDYDLIFPSNYYLEMMIQQKMIQKIDSQAILNTHPLDPYYLSKIQPTSLEYGIPYLVSHTGLAYRTDKIQDFQATWGLFARASLKGRMTLLNDMREAFGVALKYLGYSANTIHPAQLAEATTLLIQWKRNLAKFESEQYKNGLASAEYLLAEGYAGDILQIMQENRAVSFAYPKEGTFFSIDYAVIPLSSTQTSLATAFINFLLEPEIAAKNMAFTYYLSPYPAVYSYLPQTMKEQLILFPSTQILQRAELIKNLDSANLLYIKAWDQVKTAE